jgi:iron complex transport system substrate-binding protein
MHRSRSVRRSVLLALTLCLVALGCASTPSDVASGTPALGEPPTFPVTIEAANGSVTLDAMPTKIVSISPTATEMLFAIGAGDQVEAVDDQSNYPADAPVTDLSGFEPNVEAIASYEPDLIVYSTEPGDLGAALAGLGIPALVQPAATKLGDVYEQIDQLGVATGNASEAKDVVENMQAEIDSITGSIQPPSEPVTYYHELDDTYYSVTSSTFIGQIYSLVGLRNIADKAKGAGGGYPQLSAEYIVDADPDLIFLADTKCCGQSRQTVAKRPGWDGIAAVKNGGVIPLDDDIASRWGPRVVEYLRQIAGAVADVLEAQAA